MFKNFILNLPFVKEKISQLEKQAEVQRQVAINFEKELHKRTAFQGTSIPEYAHNELQSLREKVSNYQHDYNEQAEKIAAIEKENKRLRDGLTEAMQKADADQRTINNLMQEKSKAGASQSAPAEVLPETDAVKELQRRNGNQKHLIEQLQFRLSKYQSAKPLRGMKTSHR